MATSTSPAAEPDEHEIFRFMDLAPELRNRIYEYALVQNRFEGRFANTALLRVCKEVLGEAVGIFHSETTFGIELSTLWNHNLATRLWAQDPTAPNEPPKHSITGDMTWTEAESTLDTFTDTWPAAIYKMARIKVMIDTYDVLLPSHVLYCLARLLHRSDYESQELFVEFKQPSTQSLFENDFAFSMLYPITRMPTHLKITCHGFDNRTMESVYKCYLNGDRVMQPLPAHSTFDGVQRLRVIAPQFHEHLNAWMKENQEAGLDSSHPWYGEVVIRNSLKDAERQLQYSPQASPYIDQKLMRSVTTLERWVEMRKAGLPFGEKEGLEWLGRYARELAGDKYD